MRTAATLGQHRVGGGHRARTPGEPARQRSSGASAGSRLRRASMSRYLPLDHRPGIVAREIVASRSGRDARAAARSIRASRAFRRTPGSSRSRGRRRCGCTALSTSQRPLASTGRPSAHASSATIDRLSKVRRHDEQVGRRQRVELVLVRQKAEMMDAVVRRHLDDGLANQHEVQPARERHRVSLEVVEELCAALVRVDPADVNRERPVDPWRRRKRPGVGVGRHFRADADDNAWHVLVPRRRLNHRALLMGVVHDAANATEDWSEDRQSQSPDPAPPWARGSPCRASSRAPCQAW